MSEETLVSFFPSEPTETIYKALGKGDMGKKVFKMSNVLELIKNELKSLDLKNWEVTVKGYIEVSAGFPIFGGKSGIEATIKLSGEQTKVTTSYPDVPLSR